MSARFQFVYPSYRANPVEDHGDGGPPPKVRAKYVIPEGGIGHVYDRLVAAFLCDEKLTVQDIAKASGCDRVLTRDYAPAGNLLCPRCQEIYLMSDDPTAARYRAWVEGRPLSVRDSVWTVKDG